MEKYLATIFKELPFPCYMTYRLNEKASCMVYDIIESPSSSSDDDEELTTFILMIISVLLLFNVNHLIQNFLL